jgi:cytochrome c oxidase assembly protein subunit 15
MPVYVTLASLAPVAIGFALYKSSRSSGWRWLAVMALAAVILQGVLGGLRVVWLKDEIGILHATLAQLFFVLMCLIALFTSPWWPRTVSGYAGERVSEQAESIHPRTHALTYPLSWLVLATTALILMQLILGATMRHQHAGLAIPDFPLAYGKLWPAMDVDSVARYNQQRLEVMDANPITAFQIGLQMAHRILAAVILICAASATWLAQRWSSDRADNTRVERQRFGVARCSWLWLGLILVQAILGAATILTRKAADVATAHVLMGALSLVTGALLSILCFRSAECAAGVSPAESVSANWRMNESEPVMGVSSAGRMPATR